MKPPPSARPSPAFSFPAAIARRWLSGRPVALLWASAMFGIVTAHALPTTSVLWENLVAGGTPLHAALLDADGATPLSAGTNADGDGAVLVLGYFTGATTAATFNGEWVPLTGPASPNVPLRNTTVGDAGTAMSGTFGFFTVQSDFDQASSSTFQNIPAAGTRLAVAIFNRASLNGSTHCNIATNDAWQWKAPSIVPDFVQINLNDPGTIWLGGADSARQTVVAVAQFPGFPTIVSEPINRGLDAGADLVLSAAANGAGSLTYQWFKDGSPIAGQTGATLLVPSATDEASGAYFVRVSNAAGITDSQVAEVAVHDAPARLQNISTRGFVGTKDYILIPGFFTLGTGGKTVLIRAVGPTLESDHGVPGALEDPRLSIRDTNGAEVAFNDDWSDQADAAAVLQAFATTGAFSLPPNSRDAALLFTAPTGQRFTALVSGANDSTGVALAEVYVLDDAPSARLVNISTRGHVGLGSNVMIPGFYLGHGGTRRLLIRAVGPTLGQLAPELPPVIADPVLRVRRISDAQEVAFNDNWEENGQGASIATATNQASAFPLNFGSNDAAVILVVPPATPGESDRGYTVEVYDAAGGTGMAIAEVYELP